MYNDNYYVKSLELHLFFARIMKEHSLFLKAGFTAAKPDFSRKAEYYKNEFERLLSKTIFLSDGIISDEVLESGEIVTDFTALAETQTEKYTGIRINKELTAREMKLMGCRNMKISQNRRREIQNLNHTAINLLNGLISFKENILREVLSCKMFTANYPLLIEHIIREAKLYHSLLQTLENEGCLNVSDAAETECFWNRIMMEHAMFIRGYLGPSEYELFEAADDFSKKYAELLKFCNHSQSKTLTPDSLSVTEKLREFKTAGVKGIEECKIRSVILPLLADHVLREANHYIRLLQDK